MLRILVAAACVAGLAISAGAAEKKRAAPATAAPILYHLSGGMPRDGVAVFVGERPVTKLGRDMVPLDFDRAVHLLFVFQDAATDRPEGVAYAEVDQTVACPGDSVASTSFATHAADGTLIAQATSLPDYAAKIMDPRWTKYLFQGLCQRASQPIPPAPQPPEARPASAGAEARPVRAQMLLDHRQRPVVRSPAEAMALLHQVEADIAAAIALPDTGKYVIGDVLPHHGFAVLDASTLTERGGKKRISWFLVARPTYRSYGFDPMGYLRTSYDVDCETDAARHVLTAIFAGDGTLYWVAGAGNKDEAFAAADRQYSDGEVENLIVKACDYDGPGVLDKTFNSFPEALAAARTRNRR